MDQDRVPDLAAAREQFSAALTTAIAELNSMPSGADRVRHLRGLATLLLAQPNEFRATVVLQCPELETAEPFPDTLLDKQELELVLRLTPSNLKTIDEALLDNSASSWRQAHRVIGTAMVSLEGQFERLPLGLYVQRLGALVESGRLLARGNIAFMRLSEVRLPATGEHVA